MVAALLVLALVQSPPVTVVRTVHHEVPWRPGMGVKVAHRYGELSIAGLAQGTVVVDAVIRATANDERRASELAQSIDVPVTAGRETVFVSTVYPGELEPTPDMSYEVDLTLAVPRGAGVSVRNSFGNLTATSLAPGSRLENRFGDVVLDRCRDCQVGNRYGNVRVLRSTGSLAVENSFGDVFLDSVSDRTMVENRYGDVRGSDMEGIIHLDNRLGTVSAQRSTGSLTVINCFGDVSAWVDDTGLTDLDVVSELGQVELNLGRRLPFRLDGSTVQGDIRSGLPVRIEQTAQGQLVYGTLGQGGPVIRLSGAWADFLIQSAAKPASTLAEPAGAEERR